MMVAVCLPSRGLVYSKTMQSVIKGMQALNAVGVATDYFASHDLPIPDCHNFCVEQAMQNPAIDTFLMIEEDMYLEPAAFVALATSNEPVTTLQYNDKNGSPHGIIHFNEAGEILWGGVGATTVKRYVYEQTGTPYFRIDTRYKTVKKRWKDGKLVVEYEKIDPMQVWTGDHFEEKSDPYKYGGLDIDFYTRVRKLGMKIVMLEQYRAHHFQLIQLGEPHTNNGCHTIRQV